jgi:hypothetical protein
LSSSLTETSLTHGLDASPDLEREFGVALTPLAKAYPGV